MTFFALSLIPRKTIRKLFGYSLVWGYLGSIVFIKIFDHGLLNFFHWVEADPLVFIESPFLINLAWVPAIMIYLYFIPKPRHLFYLYFLSVCLVSAGLDEIFHQLGLLRYIFWNPFARFIVAVIWLYGATWHAEKIKLLEEIR
ncbi:MAG TPA: hypothetical protein VIM29_08595 [Bacillota bacterium]